MVPHVHHHSPRVGMTESMEVHLRHKTELLENQCGGKGFRLGSKDMLKALMSYYPYYLCTICFTVEDAEANDIHYGPFDVETREAAPPQPTKNTPFAEVDFETLA